MKKISSILFWSVVFGLILVSSVTARYMPIPAESVVGNIFNDLEIPEEFIFLFLFGLISFLIGSFVRPKHK